MRIQRFYRNLALAGMIPLGTALLIPLVFILAGSGEPRDALAAFFTGPWSNPWFLGNTLDSMALLLCASLGAAVAFRGGCFNLGCEGQMYLGGCTAAAALLAPLGIPGPAALLVAALGAIIAGGAMGGLSGILRRRFGASELITSFLLAAALTPLGDFLVSAVLRDPAANLLATRRFPPDRLLPKLLPPSALSVSIIAAILFVLLFHIFIHRTGRGYRFRIAGAAPALAEFGGIDAEKRFFPAMAVSGAFAGLTGFFAVAGTYGICYQGFPGGLGWNAIAMALIAGSEPALILPVVFLFNAIRAGADAVMLQAGFGFETAAFIQAAVLLLAALPFGSRHLRGRM